MALGAVYFFLGVDRAPVLDSESSENENEGEKGRRPEERLEGRRRAQALQEDARRERGRRSAPKKRRKRSSREVGTGGAGFPAMQLLDDPHRLCDALLARARRQVDAFEQRVARLDLCSRVACTHRLQLVAFYSYMRRYVKPSQEQAPQIPSLIRASVPRAGAAGRARIIRHVADAFVSDRNASEAMALGINALREVCGRCPPCWTSRRCWV